MLPEELHVLRKKLGLTYRQFGVVVGLSHQSISMYEKGKRNITDNVARKIRQALGFSLEHKTEAELRVTFDYLRLTFFDSTVEKIVRDVLGQEIKNFDCLEDGTHNYTHCWQMGAIRIREHQELFSQGIMLELTGSGLRQLEEHYEEDEKYFDLVEWLRLILSDWYAEEFNVYSRVQCSRLDLAIDELYRQSGNYDLHELKEKVEQGLVQTPLRKFQFIEGFKYDESMGLTIYYGSGSGELKLRLYEKMKERMAKKDLPEEDVLEEYDEKNRFELQLSGKLAMSVFESLQDGEVLGQVAINLFLSKFEVYEYKQLADKEEVMVYCEKFYAIFGDWSKITYKSLSKETEIERTMNWIDYQVIGSLAMIHAVLGEEFLFYWLRQKIAKVEFSEKQERIIRFEQAKLANTENVVAERWAKEIKRARQKELEVAL